MRIRKPLQRGDIPLLAAAEFIQYKQRKEQRPHEAKNIPARVLIERNAQ